ncbi:MAG: Glucoamylase, intracellular sporulation-specific [Caeruleum heppii]|nr:MAG: Glucoamylase, intracellular sporulation-specific [Caeruleum heppii]
MLRVFLSSLNLFSSRASSTVHHPSQEHKIDQAPFLAEEIPTAAPHTAADRPLEEWLAAEEVIAYDRLLANIAPGGSNTEDAVYGTVIASPSKEEPNYFFQWTRDAAIIMSTLLRDYSSGFRSTSDDLSKPPVLLADYASLQRQLQHNTNPSGSFTDLASLGEPKFLVSGDPFTGSWGRPQRDGPALRAITLMGYLRAYNASNPSLWKSTSPPGNAPFFRALYQPGSPIKGIIKADLEFVSRYWKDHGFDLWEEVNGLHFFTAMVQLRAMKEGAQLAATFGDHDASKRYETQHRRLQKFVTRFWNPKKQTLISTLGTTRTGFDCGNLLGSLHAHPIDDAINTDAAEVPIPFPPWDPRVLVSTYDLITDQRTRWPINDDRSTHDPLAGVAIGRYPEDVYDGLGTSTGNPWFLCTASIAEIFYRSAHHFLQTDRLEISKTAARFWIAVDPSLPVGSTLTSADPRFEPAIRRLIAVGAGFLGVLRKYAMPDGAMSEQIDGVKGKQRGARDLTWSYGAFLEAVRARRRVVERVG